MVGIRRAASIQFFYLKDNKDIQSTCLCQTLNTHTVFVSQISSLLVLIFSHYLLTKRKAAFFTVYTHSGKCPLSFSLCYTNRLLLLMHSWLSLILMSYQQLIFYCRSVAIWGFGQIGSYHRKKAKQRTPARWTGWEFCKTRQEIKRYFRGQPVTGPGCWDKMNHLKELRS